MNMAKGIRNPETVQQTEYSSSDGVEINPNDFKKPEPFNKDTYNRMKEDPELKLLIETHTHDKLNSILLFRILEELKKR